MDLTPFLVTIKLSVEKKLNATDGIVKECDLSKALDSVLPNLAQVFEISVNDELKEFVSKYLLSIIPVVMNTGRYLTDKKTRHEPWVEEIETDWECYKAYERILTEDGLPATVVMTIGKDSLKILDLLGNPRSDENFDRRGLVLGHVQSGKTSNYAGVIARAADAGYKLFIVIAGIHENLRSQTQERIDRAFIEQAPNSLRPISLTTKIYDFSKVKAEQRIPPQGVGTSLVLVVKKNARILENLVTWLSRPGSSWGKMPLLLIDDEADNASINTSNNEFDPTKINKLIREILNIFEKSSYVGYTATPFANIFIDPDTNNEMYHQDLFPRHFIYCLDAPSNYLGSERIFLEESEDEISAFRRDIEDAEGVLPRSHRSDFEVVSIPESLKEAINIFLLACAIRSLRETGPKHMSMLVNISPYALVQKSVGIIIQDYMARMSARVKAGAFMKGQDIDFWKSLKALFIKEYNRCEVDWERVRTKLPEIASVVKIFVINNKSQDRLSYTDYNEKGLKAIAIGGYTLSRGLTLEGLTVSYWNRNSKAYDTLMQMGRWFGYRVGYEDVCRLWMSSDAQAWYAHIAEASIELREDLIEMSQKGLTPEDFGLKVRNHPDTLIVTAMNKRRSAEVRTVQPDLNCKLIETWIVYRDLNKNEKNIATLETLIGTIKIIKGNGEVKDQDSKLWKNIPYKYIIEFLKTFETHHFLPYSDSAYLFAYINALENALAKDGRDFNWDVCLVSVKSQERVIIGEVTIGKQRRTVGGKIIKGADGKMVPLPYDDDSDSLKDGYRITSKQRVASRGLEKMPLDFTEIKAAEEEWKNRKKTKNVSDRCYRQKLKNPFLMLHVIDLYSNIDEQTKIADNVPAWGASFPDYKDLNVVPLEYTVSKNWLKQFENIPVEPEEE
jgi:hypothetical protein